ncbi:hypothetical protein NL676_019606 [Syzygium grande]|nr:hypothetical protein NL676_019606 [Syzygium grande]
MPSSVLFPYRRGAPLGGMDVGASPSDLAGNSLGRAGPAHSAHRRTVGISGRARTGGAHFRNHAAKIGFAIFLNVLDRVRWQYAF